MPRLPSTLWPRSCPSRCPVAPIMYAAGWYEYNTTNYTGWVDKDNQYMDPSPNPANVAYVILHLIPKG